MQRTPLSVCVKLWIQLPWNNLIYIYIDIYIYIYIQHTYIHIYHYLQISKLPQFRTNSKRDFIKFKNQKFWDKFKSQSYIQNKAFTKINYGNYSFRKIKLNLRRLKGLSKIPSESNKKNFLNRVLN